MKIANSDILLSSQHSAVEKHEMHESLRMWVDNRQPESEAMESLSGGPRNAGGDIITLSEKALTSHPTKEAGCCTDVSDAEQDPRFMVIKMIIEKLTGRKIKLLSAEDLDPGQKPVEDPHPDAAEQQKTQPGEGFGVAYDYSETHYESEQITFSAEGVIKTADGKEIKFSVTVGMSREFVSQENIAIRMGDAVKDPLVINFGGTAAQLADAQFGFDINSDGHDEQIPLLGPNSGFLVLDRNDDGKIKSGNELFGPATGNGFAELATLDRDHNSWIDENDPMYDRLGIWSRDAQEQDTLASIRERNIGAIYLGNLNTLFVVKDKENTLQGQLRSSGIYVNEDGSVGTLQQLDLAV